MTDANDDLDLDSAPLLPEGVTSDVVADACRRGALSFCRGVAAGWTKRDLAEWLVGDYEDASLTLRESLLPPPMLLARPSIDQDRILQLIDPAWQAAVTCIEDFARGAEARYLDEALERGSIVEAWTPEGESLFVPLNRPGLPLAVRVRSLLVSDFLIRPEDYEGDIRVCSECNVVLLGLYARDRGMCEDHLRKSGLAPSLEGGLDELSHELAPEWLRVSGRSSG